MHVLIYLCTVAVLLASALIDHKTRELPALYWWILVGLALINYVVAPWNTLDLSLVAVVTVFGVCFWWLDVWGQADTLVLVASSAIAPGLAIDYMAWSVIALGGLIPAFLWFSFRGQTSFGTGLREFRVQFTMPHIPMMALFAIGYIVAPLVVGAVTL